MLIYNRHGMRRCFFHFIITIRFLIPIVFSVLNGCQSLSLSDDRAATDTAQSSDGIPLPNSAAVSDDELPTNFDDLARQQPRQYIREVGSGKFTADAGTNNKSAKEGSAGNIQLNFEGTDLREFIQVILGNVLEKNYLIDPKITGTVTINTTQPLNKLQVIALFEDILDLNSAAMTEINGIYHVVPKEQLTRELQIPRQAENELKPGNNVRLIPLNHIAAEEMVKILEPFVPESSNLRIDRRRNLIIASGTSQELAAIQDTIDIFDVDWLRGMSVGLYPLDYVDPNTLKSELDRIMGAMQGSENQTPLDGLVRTVAIERLNSLLIIGSTPGALRELELWLHRLDRPGEHVGQRLYVYEVQNAKAVDIADILGNIFGTASRRGISVSDRSSLAPGLSPVELTTSAVDANISSPGSGESGRTGLAVPTDRPIEIIADDVRNALVVLATPQDYKMVSEAIRKLDVVPLQVLIEASILEVTLRDDLSYGVEWFFKNTIDGGEGKGSRSTLDLGGPGVSALSPGFSFTIVDAADQVRVALNALENASDLNVLSSPSLMVLDNRTAMINVGDEIPIPTRQSTSNVDPSAPTVNEIRFRQTGVTLTVTPRVNSGGLVTMDIKQEVSTAVGTTSSDIDAPTIQQRQIESVVAVNSGETIVLGGLIQDTRTDNNSGIPVLKRIPLIGNLFGQTSREKQRTELLVLITPRVVGSRQDARDITDEFRKKLRGLIPLKEITKQSFEDSPS